MSNTLFTAKTARKVTPEELTLQLLEKAEAQYMALTEKDLDIKSLQTQIRALNEIVNLKDKKIALHEKHIKDLNRLFDKLHDNGH